MDNISSGHSSRIPVRCTGFPTYYLWRFQRLPERQGPCGRYRRHQDTIKKKPVGHDGRHMRDEVAIDGSGRCVTACGLPGSPAAAVAVERRRMQLASRVTAVSVCPSCEPQQLVHQPHRVRRWCPGRRVVGHGRIRGGSIRPAEVPLIIASRNAKRWTRAAGHVRARSCKQAYKNTHTDTQFRDIAARLHRTTPMWCGYGLLWVSGVRVAYRARARAARWSCPWLRGAARCRT